MGTLLRFYLLALASVVCGAGLFAAGCSRHPAEENYAPASFAQITQGMELEAVEAVLGKGRDVSWDEVEAIVSSFPETGVTQASCDRWIMWGKKPSYGLVGLREGKVENLLSR